MTIAVTGATGFIGHYVVRHLTAQGHRCRCWYRPHRDRPVESTGVQWIAGALHDLRSVRDLVSGCDAVVHAALSRPGIGFRGAEGNLVEFAERNVIGSLQLIEGARAAGVPRFVFLSSCAVHEIILEDRPLDEAHPMWPDSHYGAHKAAIEAFVYSYGNRDAYEICALRPCGVYGLHHRPTQSKWYRLIKAVAHGDVSGVSDCGGKEVHAADVARAVGLLLTAPGIAGQAYNCCDLYVSQQTVALITARLTNTAPSIELTNRGPKHEIDTTKLQALGMTFGGRPLLERTLAEILRA